MGIYFGMVDKYVVKYNLQLDGPWASDNIFWMSFFDMFNDYIAALTLLVLTP